MTGRYLTVLRRRGAVAVTGPAARAFLQNLVTQDLDPVSPERAVYAALLTAQGRFLHDFLVVAQDDGLLLDCEGARVGDLVSRLQRFRLRAKVEIADRSAAWAALAAWGDGALEALGLPATAGAARPWQGGVLFTDPRLAALGARALMPEAAARSLLVDFGFAEATEDDYDRHRLELAVPDGSRDLEVEKTVAVEGNLDALGAIAWEKGCYIGQELTTRYRHRGLVKRRLFPVRVDGPLPAPGSAILADGQEAGIMRSGADGRGLAFLRLEAVASGAPLLSGAARLWPVAFPWPTKP